MKNKNNKKILGLSLGAMVLLSSVSMPVYAADNNIEYAYNQVLLNKDVLNGNNVIEQNGVKLTVTKIEATKNKIKVSMELETNGHNIDEMNHDYIRINVKMNDIQRNGGSGSRSGEVDGKVNIEETIENEEGYPEKGTIRIDAVSGSLGLNGTLKIPVDFTEDFNNTFIKDINKDVNVDGKKFNIEKFESNQLETGVITSKNIEDKVSLHHRSYDEDLKFIVNVDGSLYYSNFPDYCNEKDNKEYSNYTSDKLSYDIVKNASEIKVIPITNKMTDEEIEEFYNRNRDESSECIESDNNVKYPQKIVFNDNSEGNFNVVREDDKIKVYCNSDSELKSMLMAVNLYGSYVDSEENYDELPERDIYKDKSKDNQYVVEFNDTEKNKSVSFEYNHIIYNIDKFTLGDEIKVK